MFFYLTIALIPLFVIAVLLYLFFASHKRTSGWQTPTDEEAAEKNEAPVHRSAVAPGKGAAIQRTSDPEH